MDTLSYGYKKPANGDKGSVFFPALAVNAQLTNDHTHNGSDSAPILAKSLTKGSVAVTNSGWTASGNYFRKTVAFPSGYTWGNHEIVTVMSGGATPGARLYPHFEKIDTTNAYVYMPVDDQALTLLFV